MHISSLSELKQYLRPSQHYAVPVTLVREAETASAEQQPQKCAQAEPPVLIHTVLFFMWVFSSIILESCADSQEETLQTFLAFCCLN